jgi:hypothetical protein
VDVRGGDLKCNVLNWNVKAYTKRYLK